MEIKEIFELFDEIGCCTFATVDGDTPETRIAHFVAFDEEGLYFMTMNTKPFYRQLKSNGKVSVCGMSSDTQVWTGDDGQLMFEPGYFIRLTGDVREVSMDEIKSKKNPSFDFCLEDQARYNAMTVFAVHGAKGEIYDFDYDRIYRDHKLERKRFAYGGYKYEPAGLKITDKCTGCGTCFENCTFDAIEKKGSVYAINGSRCDECGTCFMVCPAGAVMHKGEYR